ncbi:methyl-accepting chemotaxis protein [Jutongia hominis]|uniref:Methyl-accepting chemotaxis protein n=1 Tax=Jutongia hominis TaxID=2763664 RepID=A0ABR7MW39_9FIRM|nr:methyl-accepting chemotaxis protein [Jutongia hominis]MBC8558016.1 methyl-accepting chemotaxis protein [Jutongia hominis]
MKEQNTNSQNEKREHKKIPIFSSLKFKMVLMLIVATAVTAATLLLIMVPFSERQIKNETKNYMYDIAQSSCSILDIMTSTDDAALKEHFQNVGVEGISSSYAYIVSSDGTMLYHPTAEKIGKSVENAVIKGVVSELKNGQKPENKVVTYDFNGVNKYAAYNISKDQSKIVVISADESEVLQPVNNMMKLAVFALIVVVVIVSAIGAVITEIALRPIIRVSQIVQKMADLDFSENENTEKMKKRKDETGVMTRSVALLREELVDLLEGIQKQSVQLFKTSANLDGDSDETQKMVEQVDRAVGDIATGATSQAQETQNATENVIAMGNMIEDTNAEAERLNGNAQQMKDSSDQAMQILKELNEINDRTKQSIEEVYTQTNITNESVQKIKEATVLIASIAEETNLLSLNASIEAARAGEQGKGFAVVASQIQKLAEQSNESASQIDEITNALISDSTKSVETIAQVRDIMNEQSEKMEKTDSMFRQVNTGVDHAMDSVNTITEKTELLNQSREKIIDVVQNLSAIAEENAASSQETSASITQVNTVVTDISDNASGLKDIAYHLENDVKRVQL